MPAMAFPGRHGTTRSAMSTLSGATSTNPAGLDPAPPTDWPKQATTSIVKVVDTVRDKTTGPALSAAQWVVYGTVIALLAVPLLVFLLVGTMRLLEGLLSTWLNQPMWIVYLFFGLIFTVAGRLLWGKARNPSPVD